MEATSPSVATIPPPEKLREELISLYRAARHTRALLRLSERVHAGRTAPSVTVSVSVAPAAREVAHAG